MKTETKNLIIYAVIIAIVLLFASTVIYLDAKESKSKIEQALNNKEYKPIPFNNELL